MIFCSLNLEIYADMQIGSRADLTSKGSIIKSAKYFLEKGQIVCDEKRVPSYTRNPAVAGLIEDFSPKRPANKHQGLRNLSAAAVVAKQLDSPALIGTQLHALAFQTLLSCLHHRPDLICFIMLFKSAGIQLHQTRRGLDGPMTILSKAAQSQGCCCNN